MNTPYITGKLVSLGTMNENSGWPITGAFVEVSREAIKAITGNYMYERVALVPVAALAELEREEWQPIETAPKNGTNVDLWAQLNGVMQRIANAYCFSDGIWMAEWEHGSQIPTAIPNAPTHWRAITGPK